jgi:hypothetical protein
MCLGKASLQLFFTLSVLTANLSCLSEGISTVHPFMFAKARLNHPTETSTG